MRRWVRYEAPIMVCVELGDDGYTGKVTHVALGDEHDDLRLARDHRDHFLIYDETMERVSVDERAATRAVTIAEYREWPTVSTGTKAQTSFATPTSTTRQRRPGRPRRPRTPQPA